MEIIEMSVEQLKPYENNPRKNDDAVDKVAASIREFGFKVPIIVDKDNVIVAGHTRLKAAEKIGMKIVPVIRADDLTEEQVRAFRLVDNKTAELAGWDFDLLEKELKKLDDFDMERFGFDKLENEQKVDDVYTTKSDIPHYEVDGINVGLSDLVDTNKADLLIHEIRESNVSDEEKDFLVKAACRLYVFEYSMIAEYYAKSTKEMQVLMEKLALVLIDMNNAIANGYVKLSKRLAKIMEKDNA